MEAVPGHAACTKRDGPAPFYEVLARRGWGGELWCVFFMFGQPVCHVAGYGEGGPEFVCLHWLVPCRRGTPAVARVRVSLFVCVMVAAKTSLPSFKLPQRDGMCSW